MRYPTFALWLALSATPLHANLETRRLGIEIGPFPPGARNQITDVAGVKVGHATLIRGQGKLVVGQGPVRTGVTVVVPAAGDLWINAPLASVDVFNGNGEAMGVFALRELRGLPTPIGLTNTMAVGDVYKGLARATLQHHPELSSLTPVVFECDDSSLNDIHGEHVKPTDALAALAAARPDFDEGAVGAGTGMIAFDFKAGIGSASRKVPVRLGKNKPQTFVLGVLVNANLGTHTRNVLRVLGVPIGSAIPDLMPTEKPSAADPKKGAGSIVMIVATDAPLDNVQLQRLARRTFSGVARLGTPGYHGSGDFALAFTTANRLRDDGRVQTIRALTDDRLNDLFDAVADATEEAVLNALLSAKTTEGRDGNVAYALPGDRLRKLLVDAKRMRP